MAKGKSPPEKGKPKKPTKPTKPKKKQAAKAVTDYGNRALSVLQPWAWAITDLDKRIENRSKANGKEGPGGLWIHASAGEKALETKALYSLLSDKEAKLLDDAIAGGTLARGAIVAYCQMEPCRPVEEISPADRWTVGPFCYRVDFVRKLREPVPLKGRQGFWSLSDEVVAECVAQLGPKTIKPTEPNKLPGETPRSEEEKLMHGAKPHVKLTPIQVEALEETLDKIADLELDLAPARKKLEDSKDKADRAKKAVDGLLVDRKKLLEHLVSIRSGKWQQKLPLQG